MIIRILSEGQYELKGAALGELDDIDNELLEAVTQNDSEAFDGSLKRVLDLVRGKGVRKADSFLGESDLILPAPDMSLAEARDLFNEYPVDLLPQE